MNMENGSLRCPDEASLETPTGKKKLIFGYVKTSGGLNQDNKDKHSQWLGHGFEPTMGDKTLRTILI